MSLLELKYEFFFFGVLVVVVSFYVIELGGWFDQVFVFIVKLYVYICCIEFGVINNLKYQYDVDLFFKLNIGYYLDYLNGVRLKF